MSNNLSATLILIIINAIVFIAETTAGGSTNTRTALRFGAFYTPYIEEGQWWRLFTSMFVHFGIAHILSNLYALYSLGNSVENFFGPVVFLIIYFVSGLCGNLLTFFVERRTKDYTVSAGASGAVFGLMGVYLAMTLLPRYRQFVPVASLFINLAINLGIGLVNRRINMKAHIGGLLGGVVVTLLYFLLFTV